MKKEIVAGLIDWIPPAMLEIAARKNAPNLVGDRDIEWSWISSQMPSGPGEALDFGCGKSFLALIAAQQEFQVTAIDLVPVRWHYLHPSIQFTCGNILELPLPTEHFDLVINCSTLEHVGLTGRCSVADGDLEAMTKLRELMKPNGMMLLTIPVGQDDVFLPMCRIYGTERLPMVLEGYAIEKETFWVKDDQNRWTPAEKEIALSFKASVKSWNPFKNVYALGCFVLHKDNAETAKEIQWMTLKS